jgi:hypothetical protein
VTARPAVALAALAAALLLLLVRAVQAVGDAVAGVGFVLSLDYGEGIVLQQALMLTGPRAYGDIAQYPFIVFHYPPVYLLAVRALAALGVEIVAAGRIVSIAATLALAAIVAALAQAALGAAAGRVARCAAAALAALALLACYPVARWMPLARVDMLATALTMAGLAVAVLGQGGRWRPHAAAALFTLAVFAKQTAIAAPIAATIVLLLARPGDAWRMVATGLALSGAILAAAMLLTDGGFLRHLVAYNVNRYSPDGITLLIGLFVLHAPLIAAALGGLAAGLRRGDGGGGLAARLRADPAARAVAALGLHLAVSTPLLALVLKSGANWNYFIEWLCAVAALAGLLAGLLVAGLLAPGRDGRPARSLALLALSAGLLTQHLLADPPAHPRLQDRAAMQRIGEELLVMVRAAPGPVLSDEMVLLVRAGRQVPWEAAIFAELGSLGRWDERLITELIRGGHFAFAITGGRRGERLFDSRYNPPVADALEAAFPDTEERAWLVVRRPASAR